MANYVIFAPHYDYTRLSYMDIILNDNIDYISSHTDSNSRIVQFLFRVAYSKLFWKAPKRVLNRLRYSKDFVSDDQLIFIFYADIADMYINDNSNYLDYIRKKYKQAKLVWFSVNPFSEERQNPIEIIKDKFDLLVTTEVGDAKRFDILHYPDFMSYIAVEGSSEENYDVFFLGAGKNRIKTIINAYDILKDKGLKCKFIITDTKESDHINREGVSYSERIDYKAYISMIQNCKSILEICSPNQYGSTLRAIEAVIYQKKLFTNNRSLTLEPHYISENVMFIDEITDNVSDFINAEYKYNDYARQSVGPEHFLAFIENKL